jgi:hypothetical protein
MWDSASGFSTFALDIERPINEDKRLVQRCTIDFLRLRFDYRSVTYIDGKTSLAIRFAFITCKAQLCMSKALSMASLSALSMAASKSALLRVFASLNVIPLSILV